MTIVYLADHVRDILRSATVEALFQMTPPARVLANFVGRAYFFANIGKVFS